MIPARGPQTRFYPPSAAPCLPPPPARHPKPDSWAARFMAAHAFFPAYRNEPATPGCPPKRARPRDLTRDSGEIPCAGTPGRRWAPRGAPGLGARAALRSARPRLRTAAGSPRAAATPSPPACSAAGLGASPPHCVPRLLWRTSLLCSSRSDVEPTAGTRARRSDALLCSSRPGVALLILRLRCRRRQAASTRRVPSARSLCTGSSASSRRSRWRTACAWLHPPIYRRPRRGRCRGHA